MDEGFDAGAVKEGGAPGVVAGEVGGEFGDGAEEDDVGEVEVLDAVGVGGESGFEAVHVFVLIGIQVVIWGL